MKKLTAILTAAVMMFSASVTAYADTVKMTPILGCDCYKEGTLTITISNSLPNLLGVHLSIRYDHTKLRFKEDKTEIGHGNANDDGTTLEWSTLIGADGQEIDYDTPLTTLTFDTLDYLNRSDGPYIEIGVVEAYDNDMKDVDFAANGRVIFSSSGIGGYVGDIDRDGAYTASDALEILRLSMQDDWLDILTEFIADSDHDHHVTANDALQTLRYSIGMPDETGHMEHPCYTDAIAGSKLSTGESLL